MTSMSRSILTAVYAVLRRCARRFDRSVDPLLVTDMRALRVTDTLDLDTGEWSLMRLAARSWFEFRSK